VRIFRRLEVFDVLFRERRGDFRLLLDLLVILLLPILLRGIVRSLLLRM